MGGSKARGNHKEEEEAAELKAQNNQSVLQQWLHWSHS